MKGVVFLTVFLGLTLALGERASAMVEYCPARLDIRAVDSMSGVYALSLSALSPRSVSGNVAIHTEQGWYGVRFDSVKLSGFDEKWQSRGVRFTRSDFVSDYLYVRFAQPAKVLSAFVSDAKTAGEVQFGWDTKGDVACAGLSDEQFSRAGKKPTRDLELLNPRPSPAPGEATTFLVPSIAAAPGESNCPVPFADAYVSRAISPDYPAALRSTAPPPSVTIVEIAVSATGAIDDAWIYVPSGFSQFDAAALISARASTYRPARSFCQEVPGQYLFRAEFRPN